MKLFRLTLALSALSLLGAGLVQARETEEVVVKKSCSACPKKACAKRARSCNPCKKTCKKVCKKVCKAPVTKVVENDMSEEEPMCGEHVCLQEVRRPLTYTKVCERKCRYVANPCPVGEKEIFKETVIQDKGAMADEA
jgi:hypothetical protein